MQRDLSALDSLFLERACELARRGIGSTSPNPPVGAVVARGDAVAGEAYHHRAGEPHAEVLALREAGSEARGATLYVSLEPCNHHGRTPPCTQAVIDAGITRVVIGAMDPNPKTAGGGMKRLQEHSIETLLADLPAAHSILEQFAHAIRSDRPYVALKMAMSLDGYVAAQQGKQHWLTGDAARGFVRELRIGHDAIAVGAGTVRVDDPKLTVRPPHHRERDYVRVVFCETEPVDPRSNVFARVPGYAETIVLAPAGAREKFAPLTSIANVRFVGDASSGNLDIAQALRDLRTMGVFSLLCEGGPTLAGRLLEAAAVDRFYWLVAPAFLRSPGAVPVVAVGTASGLRDVRIDRVERLKNDVLISGTIAADV